jgi:hypothetical protein
VYIIVFSRCGIIEKQNKRPYRHHFGRQHITKLGQILQTLQQPDMTIQIKQNRWRHKFPNRSWTKTVFSFVFQSSFDRSGCLLDSSKTYKEKGGGTISWFKQQYKKTSFLGTFPINHFHIIFYGRQNGPLSCNVQWK